jgi:hypothetical protein
MSIPMTRAPASSASSARNPVPVPTSATTIPGVMPAAAMAARLTPSPKNRRRISSHWPATLSK